MASIWELVDELTAVMERADPAIKEVHVHGDPHSRFHTGGGGGWRSGWSVAVTRQGTGERVDVRVTPELGIVAEPEAGNVGIPRVTVTLPPSGAVVALAPVLPMFGLPHVANTGSVTIEVGYILADGSFQGNSTLQPGGAVTHIQRIDGATHYAARALYGPGQGPRPDDRIIVEFDGPIA